MFVGFVYFNVLKLRVIKFPSLLIFIQLFVSVCYKMPTGQNVDSGIL